MFIVGMRICQELTTMKQFMNGCYMWCLVLLFFCLSFEEVCPHVIICYNDIIMLKDCCIRSCLYALFIHCSSFEILVISYSFPWILFEKLGNFQAYFSNLSAINV
jgi:hypothetical protein